MCGRFALFDTDKLAERFEVEVGVKLEPRYNVTPGAVRPVITGKEKPKFQLMEWGLIPFWAKDNKPKGLINARAETLAEKPSFRQAFRERRCLVPANGFYEWQKLKDFKQPYFIGTQNDGLMAMAGLYEENRENGKLTFTIITKPAVPEIKKIHERMPVVLKPESEKAWLQQGFGEEELMGILMEPVEMVFRPVPNLVNNPGNDGEELIAKGDEV